MFKIPFPIEENQSTTTTNSFCHVCGDNASIINYGALACPSCRTFFRRNGFPTKTVSPCRFTGDCKVTKTSRRCTACRLAKCLAIGMSPELIRKEDLSAMKRKSSDQLLESQPEMKISQSAVDTSLNSTEWNTISKVVHAFDTFSPVSEIRRVIEVVNTSASNIQFDLSQSLQMMSSFSNSLQLFISSTPDFKVLSTAEQWALLQRNLLGLLSIGGIYFMRESGIFDSVDNEKALLPLYDNEILQRMKNLNTRLDFDPALIKLILLALAFSSSCFTKYHRRHMQRDGFLLGTFRLFGSQNFYVELTWKYLIHRYDYKESVQRFSNLITRILDTVKLSLEIYDNNPTFQIFIDQMVEQIEQSPMINEKTIIPLWGKS